MTHPIVMQYHEGAETYSVDAAGHIGRPAINMAPSGRWRFAGVVHKRGRSVAFIPWRDVVQRLASGEALPSTLYIRDVDCGTNREHGRAVDWIRLNAGVDVSAIVALDQERVASDETKRAAAQAERVRVASKGRELWRDSRYPIALVEYGLGAARWIVRDGDEATERLEASAAASALGFAIMESAQNEESGNVG